MIEIILNGEPRQVPEARHVKDLLDYLKIDPSRVAVELNRRIVRKVDWTATTVPPGARLEVVQFVGGG